MKKLLSLLVFICASLLASNAHAEEQDGSFFLQSCGAAVKQADGGQLTQDEGAVALVCVAYISGFLDAMTLTAKFTKGKRNVCTPERGVSNSQAARLLVKYLRENPQTLHESGRMSLYIALGKAFPCPK